MNVGTVANPIDAYAIDPTTGEITLTVAGVAALTNDFEALANSHQITVSVSDGSGSPTTIQVTLTETNVDDNSPVFTNQGGSTVSSYSFSYAENRATTDVLGRVYATDADGDSITFAISVNVNVGTVANPIDAYAIDPTTGEITLTAAGVAALTNDFEALANSHQITVSVSDGLGSPTTIQVTLTETNVDDNGPVFTNQGGSTVSGYSFSYAENRTTTDILGRVYATDADGDSITFAITANVNVGTVANPVDAYAIDPTTGEITLTAAGAAALTNDFEALANSHQITVSASDGSGSPTTIQVTLAETNIDDNSPVFTNQGGSTVSSYSFSYAENRTTTDVLGRVYATDADGDSLTFAISVNVNVGTVANPIDAYAIDPTTGEITLTAAGVAALTNDFEALANSHQITVSASDGSGSPTTIQVTLTETNVDDNSPVFTNQGGSTVSNYSFFYAENRTTTDVLGRIYATDADGDSITFAITANVNVGTVANPIDAYTIDPTTGEITLTAAGVAALTNDFEALANSHQITVSASDGSGSPTTIQVTLTETNVDDNSPVFTNQGGSTVSGYSFSYAENRTTTDVLGRVYATDADGDSITFAITTNVNVGTIANPVDAYAIDPTTGEITLTAAGVAAFANDYELPSNSHQITIAASDGLGSPTTIQVTLTETDAVESGRANDDNTSVTETAGAITSPGSGTATGNVLGNDTGGQAGVVTSVRLGQQPGQGQAGVIGTAWRGNYGTLTLRADGSFTYVLDDSMPVVDALPTGGRLEEVFNYTRVFAGTTSTALLRIAIVGANDPPQLLATAITFNAVAANTGLPEVPGGRVGVLVSGLASPGSGPQLIADNDVNAVVGFAITGADETRGTWWFSMNDGGSWSRLGQVSSTQALLLPGSARLFFRPERGVIGHISQALILRAWDQTAGSEGRIVPVSTLGTALSVASATVSLRVEVPGATVVDFDTLSARSVTAPAGNLVVQSSATTERTVSNITAGSRVTTLGSGSLRLLSPLGNLTLGRGGTGVVIVQGLRSSATLHVEASFGTVTFSATGRLLSRHTPSQLMAIRRSMQISGSGSRLTFAIKGTI